MPKHWIRTALFFCASACVSGHASFLLAQEHPFSMAADRTTGSSSSRETREIASLEAESVSENLASTALPTPSGAPFSPVVSRPFTAAQPPESHRFWNRENSVLFATVGGLAAADFYVTHANLAGGGKELNPVTRVFAGSTPALATNFALETSSVVVVSYLFHRSGHHRLERAAALFNIGFSGASVGYSFSHH